MTRVYIFCFSLRDVVENEEMMDANSIQVNILYIYSSRKASEREGKVYFTGTQSYAIQFTQRNRVQGKKRNYKFIEQNLYLCLKALYKYV